MLVVFDWAGEDLSFPRSAAPGDHTAYFIAADYARLNQHREALDWLQKAATNGFPCYPLFAKDPNLKNFRTDPDHGKRALQRADAT